MLPENRLSILGEIREALVSVWGPSYGWGVLNQVFLPDIESKKTVNSIRSVKNDLKDIQKDLDHYLIEAKLQRDLLPEKKKSRLPIKPAKEVVVKEQEAPTHETETVKDEQVHSKAQYLLIQLGKITKCSVWIASNDKSKIYMAENLGSGCLDSLPNLGLSEEATKRIKLIDVIWLHQKAPICAFEVEATTSIYSGLLRLSDLISVIPAINIKLFIVAPQEKQTKVMAELSRPTFQKIGLSDYCRFISIQELENLLSKVKELSGHVQATILDTISIGLDNDLGSGLA